MQADLTLKYLPTYWYFIWRYQISGKTYFVNRFDTEVSTTYILIFYLTLLNMYQEKNVSNIHVFWTKFCNQIWHWSIHLHIDILSGVRGRSQITLTRPGWRWSWKIQVLSTSLRRKFQHREVGGQKNPKSYQRSLWTTPY